MQYHNFHTHSIYSDGKYTLREMTDAAIERGFTNLGFSWGGDWSNGIKDFQHFEKPLY